MLTNQLLFRSFLLHAISQTNPVQTEEYRIYIMTQDTTTTETTGATMKLSALATIQTFNSNHPHDSTETAHQNFITLNGYHLSNQPTPQPPTKPSNTTVVGLATAGIYGFTSSPINNPSILQPEYDHHLLPRLHIPRPKGTHGTNVLPKAFSSPHKLSYISWKSSWGGARIKRCGIGRFAMLVLGRCVLLGVVDVLLGVST